MIILENISIRVLIFSQIEGYGPEMTKALLTFDYSELDWIVNNYLYLSTVEEGSRKKNTLKDITVVITGKLKNL